MKTIYLDENYIPDFVEKSAIAIGKFDGIHLGHAALLQSLLDAKKQGFVTVVFSFDKSISAFFSKEETKLIMTDEDKFNILGEIGIDILAVYPVNEKSMAIEPEAFVEKVLCAQLNAGLIAAGNDVSFGRYGRGDMALLQKMAAENDFRCEIIEKVCEENGREISSSYIREEIAAGHMEKTERLLGRAYTITGTVEKGNQIGRTIGFPTANIIPNKNLMLPHFGVYAVNVYINNKKYYGITNIGQRPTIGENLIVNAETYIFDFYDDIYGEKICLELKNFIRGEMKFESLDELKKQIEIDKETVRGQVLF